MSRGQRLLFRLAFGCLALLASCVSAPRTPWERKPDSTAVRERYVDALGTRFVVRLWLDPRDRRSPDSLFKPALAEIRRVARMTDADDTLGELALLNGRAALGAVRASPELAYLLTVSQQLNARSGGAFDVTFAPIQEENERFGPDAGIDGGDREIAPQGIDDDTRARVGQRLWTMDPKTREVVFSKPGIKLVLRGVAKGYAAQKAAEKLAALRVPGFAVIAGNSFAASGTALRSRRLMCVEDFYDAGRCALTVTPKRLDGIFYLAMAASADRPGHNYNPKSGARTFRSGGAAVIGPDGAWTQGAATVTSIIDESKFADFFKPGAIPVIAGLWAGDSTDSAAKGSLEPYARTAPVPQ